MKPTVWIAIAGFFFTGPALAGETAAASPYSQVRGAIDEMDTMIDTLDRTITKRLGRTRGPSIECLEEHHNAIINLRDLAQSQRAELVEAMADGQTRTITAAHRSVMLWRFKAGVHEDAAAACPSQHEYELQKDLEAIEAAMRD